MILPTDTDQKIFNAVRLLVVICGWCPDKEEKTAEAVAKGFRVTHGMCPECSARLFAELDKETNR